MVSTRSSKRGNEQDLADQSPSKRRRNSSAVPAVAAAAFRASAGPAQSRDGRTREVVEAPPGQGRDEEGDYAGSSRSYETPNQIMRKIQRAVDVSGPVAAFTRYVQPILDMPEDMVRNNSLFSISKLMKIHGTDGTFWTEAWPIEVYAEYDEGDDSFDTLWSGDYNDNVRADLLDERGRMRLNWYHALKFLRDNGAESDMIVDLAKQYKEAIGLANDGVYVNPILDERDQSQEEQTLTTSMEQARLRKSWLDAIGRLRAVFGDTAAEELQSVFHGMIVDGQLGNVESCDKSEREIWWAYLQKHVTRPSCLHRALHLLVFDMCRMCIGKRTRPMQFEWFEALMECIQNMGMRFNQYGSIKNMVACVAYVRDGGRYEDMCQELEEHVVNLRRVCFEAAASEWQAVVKAGETLMERNRRFKMYHLMKCHFEAGGLPYSFEDLQQAANTTDPNRLSPAKAAMDFRCPWRVAMMKADELDRGVYYSLLDQWMNRSKKEQAEYGPGIATTLRDWRKLIKRVQGGSLDGTTEYRFRDLHDRVLEFYENYGIIVASNVGEDTELSDEVCEALVRRTQDKMEVIDTLTWNEWRLFCAPLGEDTEWERLNGIRNELRPRGYFWLPYDPTPVLPTRSDRSRSLGFGGERSKIQGEWRWQGPLGAGSWGDASLWRQHNRVEDLSDQLVIKECYQGKFFNVPAYWEGHMYRRVIKEEKIMRDMGNIQGSDTMVRSRGYAIYESLRMYRIYMEYCPHGDVEEMILRAIGRGESVPERQLWSIFQAMVSALCILRDGRLPGAATQGESRKVVVHRDIKPANIFLGRVQEREWKEIPAAKLGDFGLATEWNQAMRWQTGIGTKEYRAPEQQEGAGPEQSPGVCSASDLWAVGRVLLSLMNLQEVASVEPFQFTGDKGVLAFKPHVEQLYSEELRGLVVRCLEEDSLSRPGVDEVWEAIRQKVDAVVGATGNSMKEGDPPAGEPMIDVKKDRYAERLARRL